MEKTLMFQQAILDFLHEYAEGYDQDPDDPILTQIISDKENNHYQLVRVGWRDRMFHHFCLFHFDIIDEKIWIQANNTEVMVGDELVKRGVPKQEIVLGFQPVYARVHTGFGS
ncbi:MAG: XisI protein [Bacteroidota bacterium]